MSDEGHEVITGYRVRKTPQSGFYVIELDYWADEAKDEMWAAEMRARMGEKQFRREFLRDWTTASGDAFYPEFILNREHFIAEAPGVPAGMVIYRGWDFGFRRPACVWFLYSAKQGRVWVIREWSPESIDTHTFRDVVLYLSGQVPGESLDHHGQRFVNQIIQDPRLPDPPWFEPSATRVWRDFSGPEALQLRSEVSADSQERCNADILAAAGVQLGVYSVALAARELVIRRLLKDRPDGRPGLMFDPHCILLVEGFSGGIAYAKPTKANPHPTKPQKEGRFEHVHDALNYGVVNVVPIEEVQPVQRAAPSSMPGRGVYSRSSWDGVRDPGDLRLKENRGWW